jgi:hypothetical protein
MKKTDIIDTKSVSIRGQRVLFDANIWILINGFGADSAKHRANLYSATYKTLLAGENRIVTNDYVLGEVFNRCAKLEYAIHKQTDPTIPPMKVYRQTAAFAPALESVRDTCLNILDESEFVSVCGDHYKIGEVVSGCCSQCADFTDLVLIGFCRQENLYVMTDDADYSGSGIGIITANKKMTA